MQAFAATFILHKPLLPWLWPLLALLGICCQLAGLWLRLAWPILAGACLVFVDACMERDVTLLVGDSAATALAWYYLHKRAPRNRRDIFK